MQAIPATIPERNFSIRENGLYSKPKTLDVMNKRQSNKVNSFYKVKGVLMKKDSLFRDVPVYVEPLERFLAMMDEIEQVAKRRELDTSGETKRKNEIKIALTDKMVSLASSATLYAYLTNNIELEGAMDYRSTDVDHIRDTETIEVAMAIEEELLAHREALLEYQVSDEDLKELHDLIDQFKNAKETQGDVKSTSVADTRRFTVLLRQLDAALDHEIDRIVERIKHDNPRFYDTYQNARVIVDH